MRLLVTGGAGYIGSHCVTELLKAQHEVTVVDNLSTGYLDSLKTKLNKSADFIKEDVRHRESIVKILKLKKIEAVLHFAAKLIVPESVQDPLSYYDNNVIGSLRLLQACDEAGIKKFIFSSTASVYHGNLNRPLKESDEVQPMNPYGASKRMVEQILQDYAKSHPEFKFIILRYFNVAGASLDGDNGQRSPEATHLIKVACRVATGLRQGMEIFGTDWQTPDKTCLRDYMHVQDLADAHVVALAALQKGHESGLYNCGYGKGISVKEVIHMVSKVADFKIVAKESQRREGDPQILVADSTRIRSELGWLPKYDSLELICRSALDWERKQGIS